MSTKTPKHPAGLGPVSPLDIPEILDKIFSLLEQRTIAHSVVFVSRLWLQIARRYLILEYAWSDCLEDSRDLERALTMLPWMTRLQWFAGSPCEAASLVSQERHWALLLNALEIVDCNQTTSERTYEAFDQKHYNALKGYIPPNFSGRQVTFPQNRLTRPRTGLREFELYGDVLLGRFRLILPLMTTLTRLVLKTSYGKRSDTRGWNEVIHIRLVLFHCPLLEDLHVVAGRRETLKGPWHPTTSSFINDDSAPSDPHIPSLPLRNLVIERGIATQKDLEDLLTFTPRLKSLKCVGLYVLSEYNLFDRLFHRMKELNIHLDSFHFLRYTVNSAILLCPYPFEQTLWAMNLGRSHMHLLQSHLNTITFLEIHGSTELSSDPDDLLHNYLCSSPHLLHLKAVALPFSLDHMDLHGLLPPVSAPRNGPRAASKVYLPEIWQCRKLQTLHIKIATTRNTTEDYSSLISEHARIAFGYIARVCPELRELRLSNGGALQEEPSLDMSLLGGFCLLGRLLHLESFSCGTWKEQKVLSAVNLEWIIESGRTVGKTTERQEYLRSIWMELGLLGGRTGSDGALPLDDAATVARLDLKSLASMKPGRCFDWTPVDPTLCEELRYLGLAVEVKTFFDVLDGDEGYHCFPVLRYLSLCSPGGVELSPEREIKRVTVDKVRRPWIQS